MFTLIEFLKKVYKLPDEKILSSKVYIGEADYDNTILLHKVNDALACYTFTLIRQGSCVVELYDHDITLSESDLYIYLPGIPLRIKEISKDYKASVLLADERAVYDSSMGSVLLQAICFTAKIHNSKLTLPDPLFHRLNSLLEDCVNYLKSAHLLRQEAIYLTISIFLADLIDFVVRKNNSSLFAGNYTQILVKFLKLLLQNYRDHHDVSFYADRLNITATHLSRVIKQTTGKTVMDHINRFIMMEASWLLKTSLMSINEIADTLHFADQASFCKFFKRHKNMTPTQFRDYNDESLIQK